MRLTVVSRHLSIYEHCVWRGRIYVSHILMSARPSTRLYPPRPPQHPSNQAELLVSIPDIQSHPSHASDIPARTPKQPRPNHHKAHKSLDENQTCRLGTPLDSPLELESAVRSLDGGLDDESERLDRKEGSRVNEIGVSERQSVGRGVLV